MLAQVPVLGPNNLSPNRVNVSISRLASSGMFVSSHQGQEDVNSFWKLPGGGASSCSQVAPISCATLRVLFLAFLCLISMKTQGLRCAS